MDNRNYTVYKHTSPSNKVYIGITSINPEKRWANGSGYIKQMFYKAIQKYGWNNIKHEILYTGLTKEEAEQMEMKLIAEYKSNQSGFGYNIANGGNSNGKHSEETKRKISETNKRENNPNAKKVYCEGMVFDCVGDCADYYNVVTSTITQWLNGQNPMPKEWYDKGLRYEDKKMSDYKIQEAQTGKNNPKSKKTYCGGIIFACIRECSEYYNKKYGTMRNWLEGKNPILKEFQDLGLRYATEEDILKYPVYNKEIHGEKYLIDICISGRKRIYCDGVIFQSITQCCDFYDEKPKTMSAWLRGQNKMPQKYIDLGLRYATEEDVEKYPMYKNTK